MSELDLMLNDMECRLGIKRTASDFKKPEILVVDDDRDLRNSLSDVLNNRYFVVPCDSGDVALKNCCPSKTKVVLLDIKMPGKSGLTVFKEIQELCPDVPIVFFTAHPGYHEDYLESKRLNAYAILQKGISVAQLIEVIEKALKKEQII